MGVGISSSGVSFGGYTTIGFLLFGITFFCETAAVFGLIYYGRC